MESSGWRHNSLDWAQYAYEQLLEPRLNVKGRMAVVFLVAFLWAITWYVRDQVSVSRTDVLRLMWRAYSVLQTPNDILVDKLGLDIPPPPIVTLEEISSTEIGISWKPVEPSSSIQEYQVEIDGECRGKTKKSDTAVVISNLLPGNTHDIRVFSVSTGRFETPSAPLHVRLPISSQTSTQDGSNDGSAAIRVIAARPSASIPTPSAPAMVREQSGGQLTGRRGTAGRKASPAGLDAQAYVDNNGKSTNGEVDGDLVELSQRFQKVQQDIEAAESQIQDEVRDYERQVKEAESKKDKLKQDLKKRDEESSDLRKQVHKAESQNRALLNDKTKKERELQQRESDRRKKRDEITKWEDQISTMGEEMEGIETQKAAIQRRAQSDIREVRKKIEEEQKEVTVLEAEIKDKQVQVQSLEEERKQLDVEDDTDETREADRLEQEQQQRWKQRFQELNAVYARTWNDLQQASHLFGFSRDRLALYENVRRNTSITFAQPPAPLDMDAARRGVKPIRRSRPTGSLGSNISSPRGLYSGDLYHNSTPYPSGSNASPTTYGPSFFNPSNGMTLMYPSDLPTSTAEENEPITSVPMSPHAEVLLPADLLGDESGEDEGEDDIPMPADGRSLDAGISPFPKIGSPILNHAEPAETPSAGSSSGRSFSSPREAFAPVPEADRKSMHSGQISIEKESIPEAGEAPVKKFMPSLFSFGRQRGKTMADQGPVLGSLKSGQSHSFPRNMEDLNSSSQPRRRLSYGGNWAFPGNLLQRGDAASRRAFPSLMNFGRSSEATSSYDPFAMRNNSFDPGLRGDSNSPRPSSTYSFDKMPRPSMESQFHAWNMDKPAMRNSPLAPDWGSMHSFSRSHSRRPSVHYGSTSNLSLPQPDEEIVEPRREFRSLQAPIGTRPTSSQKVANAKPDDRPSTPRLNPAAPTFTSLFKNKTKEKGKGKDAEGDSPPESRKSRDAPSLAATMSTAESRESLDRTTSQNSIPTTETKPTLMSRISRKASSNKFGSWKDKSIIFSRKDTVTPTGDADEEHNGSMEQLGKSLESTSTTPSGEDKKASRTSLNWSFMRKTRKGIKEDLAASEVSESSERASVDEEGSHAGTPVEDDAHSHVEK